MSVARPSPVPVCLKRKLDSKPELESKFMIRCNRLGSSEEDTGEVSEDLPGLLFVLLSLG